MADGRLKGKAILVTGAASGIGQATALRLAREGADLALADRNLEGAQATADEIAAKGGKATALRFEASDGASCRAMVDAAVKALGRLDVLANIAGVLQRGPFAEITEQTWDTTLAVNITSMFHITQQALPHLTAAKGNIVNMASSAAQRGVPQSAAYSASKHAVVGLTKSLSGELKPLGIRVNAISPGPIATPLIMAIKPAPGQPGSNISWGETEDVAAAVVFLASDEAKFVSGAVLTVDGSQTAVGQ